MTARRRLAVVSTLAAVLSLVACSSSDDPAEPQPSAAATEPAAPASDESYVALGDSFTSGPGITPVVNDAGSCLQSGAGYPALLADALGITALVNVSCAGATTADLLASKTAFNGDTVPPQVDAVSASTSLVTVGIGGNDGDIFTQLFRTCFPQLDPSPGACRAFIADELPGVLEATETQVVEALTAVEDKAPDARVVLVGYPRLFDAAGPCEEVPVDAADVDALTGAEQDLDATMAAAAADADVEFVSMWERSAGHDACADDPWTNGAEPESGDGVVLHPTAAGMTAVAQALEETLASAP